METERYYGDVLGLRPVDVVDVAPWKPLVNEVSPREQAAVQRDVRDPRETPDSAQHVYTATAPQTTSTFRDCMWLKGIYSQPYYTTHSSSLYASVNERMT